MEPKYELVPVKPPPVDLEGDHFDIEYDFFEEPEVAEEAPERFDM
jgi:hypothetical protein